MARGTTLGQLVEMVRDECGISSNSSRGNDQLGYITRLIKRQYEFLCDEYDWSFLRVDNDEATKTLEAGERYYDFPVEMDTKNTIECWHFYGNVWVKLDYGITMEDYTAMNPETDQRGDPTLKWRIKDGDQFEVWPLPASDGNLVRFTGTRRPTPLTANNSRCDMDDLCVVLFVAAEILAKQDQKDAPLKLAAAKARLAKMKALYVGRARVRMGLGEVDNAQRGWPRIRAFPASN